MQPQQLTLRLRDAIEWQMTDSPVSKGDLSMPESSLPHICHQSGPKGLYPLAALSPPPYMHKEGSFSVGYLAASAAEELARCRARWASAATASACATRCDRASAEPDPMGLLRTYVHAGQQHQ